MAVLKSSKNTKKVYRIINLKSKKLLLNHKMTLRTKPFIKNLSVNKRNSLWNSKLHKPNNHFFKSNIINIFV